MAVDLKTHEAKLLAAWKDVTEEKSPTDWALFGYDGHTNTLKVVSTGDGGLIEMSEDLNSNKIMYAFCRLQDPKTGLPKYVLINWQGEGAPMSRKGSCTNHMRDVAALLHGHHVTVHARDEDEVDEAAILEKLSRAGSSAYNFRQRSTETSPQSKPVGTNYHRIVPTAEINLSERDRFWEKQEQEERQRQQEEVKRVAEEKARLETERNRREMAEAKSREQQELERSRTISEVRQAERKAERAPPQPAAGKKREDDAPVGTNYHRVVPTAEINLSERDRFWEKQEQEERQRQQEEVKRVAEEKARLETERNRREMAEAKSREQQELERSRTISEVRHAERKAERAPPQPAAGKKREDDAPVGTNYHRIVPTAEINLSERDRFWEKQEQEERQRQQEEVKRVAEEKARLETERNKRELEGAKTREHLELERSRSINEARQAERKAERVLSQDSEQAVRWQQSLQQDQREEEERSHRADRLRAERKQEAEELIGHRTGEARAVFASRTAAGQLSGGPTSPVGRVGVTRRWPPAAAAHSGDHQAASGGRPPARQNGSVGSTDAVSNGHQPAEPARTAGTFPAPAGGHRQAESEPVSTARQPEPAPAHTYKQPDPAPASTYKQPDPVPASTYKQPEPVPASTYKQPEPAPAHTYTQPEPSAVPSYTQSEPAPVKQPAPAQTYTEPEPTPAPTYTQPEPTPAPSYTQPEPVSAPAYKQLEPEPTRAYTAPAAEPEPAATERGQPDGGGGGPSLLTGEVQITTVNGELASVAIAAEHGLCAQALYDYQAVDETEITFDPGDIITNIEQIDEGWWQGVSPAGQFGLFPANYVQLINA